jgi:hypothetical protein
MTSMLHRFSEEHGATEFDLRRQIAELELVTSSHSAGKTLAENYVGLPAALMRARLPGGVGMSLYQLHRCVDDWIRAGEVNSAAGGDGREGFDASAYELIDEERAAFDGRGVAAFYRLALHPVLINRYARAAGYARDEYRKLLAPFAELEGRRGRWQS